MPRCPYCGSHIDTELTLWDEIRFYGVRRFLKQFLWIVAIGIALIAMLVEVPV